MGPDGDGHGPGGPLDQFNHLGGPGGFGRHGFGWPGGPEGMGGPDWFLMVPGAVLGLLVLLAVVGLLYRSSQTALLLASTRGRSVRAGADRTWEDAVERHRALALEYARFECDPRSVLDLPALVDVRQPATARFVDAFAEACALLTDERPPKAYAQRFVEAVERAERAWAAAREAARRRGAAEFGADERALLDQLRTLLDVVDSSEFEAERRTAFEQARSRFAELERRTGWRLPARAAAAVEDRVRGALVAAEAG
jgi:BMFP domain-containing protein YqiC